MTLENGRKRQKNKFGRLIEVYPSFYLLSSIRTTIAYQVNQLIPTWSLTPIQIF